jgi:hypothetical protein
LQAPFLPTTIIYPKQIGGQIRDQTGYDIRDNFQILLPTISHPKQIGAQIGDQAGHDFKDNFSMSFFSPVNIYTFRIKLVSNGRCPVRSACRKGSYFHLAVETVSTAVTWETQWVILETDEY